MEAHSQVDSSEKSPVPKTVPPTDMKDRTSSSGPNATESKATDDQTKSKDPSYSPNSQKTPEKKLSNTSVNEDTLSHPIISVDIQKRKPCDSKQEEKNSDAVVPPEVVASVVTAAVVNEAALTIGESDGHVINVSKVSSDSSKVDNVVRNELDKLSEAMNSKTELKSVDTVIQTTKPLPNGHIDQSPNDEAVSNTTQNGFIKDTKTQSNIDEKGSGKPVSAEVTKDTLIAESSKETEVKTHTNADRTQNIETESCNGVPGVITVTNISKKVGDSVKAEEGDLATESKKSSNSPPEEEKIVNTKNATDAQQKKDELLENVCESSNKLLDNIKENSSNSNLTDSAKLNCNLNHNEAQDKCNISENNDNTGSMITELKGKEKQNTDNKQNDHHDSKMENTDNSSKADKEEKNKILDRSANKELESIKPSENETRDLDLKNETDKKEIIMQSSSTENNASASVLGDKKDVSPRSSPQSTMKDITESEIKMMMTSQILTAEDLNGEQDEEDSREPVEDTSKSENSSVVESCRISASKHFPDRCDVGVGLDEKAISTVRVASGNGDEEEVDGQQVTAEVEMTDGANADVESNSSIAGNASPTSQSTPTKIPSTTSLSSASVSQKDDESRTTSAASRSSIPEAIVYQPPERRKSAVSEEKKSVEKSQEDEKETEKADTLNEERESANTEQIDEAYEPKTELTEEKNEVKEQLEQSEKDIDSNIKEIAESDAVPKGDDKNELDDETDGEKEKGEEDEKETERTESKSDLQGNAIEAESKDDKVSSEKEEEEATSKQKEDMQDVIGETSSTQDETNASESTSLKEADEKENAKDIVESYESKGNETVTDSTTNQEVLKDTTESTEAEVHSDGKDVDVEKEAKEVDTEKDTTAIEEISKDLEEPKTLVEEEASDVKGNDDEAQEEKGDAVEKDGDDKGEEKEEKEGEEIEENEGEETMKNGGKEVDSTEANQVEDKTIEGGEGSEETKEEKQKDVDETEEKAEVETETEKGETTEEKPAEEDEEKPEPPPRSPTKRMRSPDKAGRRGISPISSPPKQLKTPPSPQKPQKTTSPKKKNGTLSPIKTPKTPGSDTRKLPPIKAPVGLAPNPNLKNIRSKIGSFDNIKYKPGGGDKKVISKKLEWKAAPKIGSLDHSFKSEKKHSKSQSKGETKDEKQGDGQSPAASGDEAEGTATAEIAETLLNQESSEMPVAIAAES